MKKNKDYKKFIYLLFGLMLSISLLLTSVQIVAFDINHYIRQYKNHDISTATGMDMENLQYVTEELLSYLRDERDDIEIIAIVKGQEREVFGEREKLHMVDVKELFIRGRWIRNIALILLIGIVGYFVMADRFWLKRLSKTLMYTAMVNIDLMIIFFLLTYFNFTKYFDYFHYIFFDNDLWILDPKTDIMIQMLPEIFFYNTAVKIAGIYIACILILGVVGFWGHKKINPMI